MSAPLDGLLRASRTSAWRLASYARNMSATRDELHVLVDQLPEERLMPVLVTVAVADAYAIDDIGVAVHG